MAPLPAARDLDALRRRVYAPDATADDVDRYRSALAAAAPAQEVDAPLPPPRQAAGPAIRQGWPEWTPHAVLIGVMVLALLVLITPWAGDEDAPATAALGATVRQDLAVPASAREGFVAALRAGGNPDLQSWLHDHPPQRPNAWFGVSRLQTEELQGTGSRTVRLHPSSYTAHGGRTTLVLVLDRQASAAWSLARTTASHGESLVGSGAMQPGPGVPGAVTVEYAGRAPAALTVVASDGVRWDALVAYTE